MRKNAYVLVYRQEVRVPARHEGDGGTRCRKRTQKVPGEERSEQHGRPSVVGDCEERAEDGDTEKQLRIVAASCDPAAQPAPSKDGAKDPNRRDGRDDRHGQAGDYRATDRPAEVGSVATIGGERFDRGKEDERDDVVDESGAFQDFAHFRDAQFRTGRAEDKEGLNPGNNSRQFRDRTLRGREDARLTVPREVEARALPAANASIVGYP